MKGELWVELVGEIIIARVRGLPTVELLTECQERVVFLAHEAGQARVLYDVLEMDAPHVQVTWTQRKLDEHLGGIHLRRAIVVPSAKLAFLARLAFGEGDYRVFYSDMSEALKWLAESPVNAKLTSIK